MTDSVTTIDMLKKELIDLCFLKGWGVNGIQDPRPVSAAMMVESMELLEHFDADNLTADSFTETEIADIAEEMADVMAYMLQLMYAVRFDVSKALFDDAGDGFTPISLLRTRIPADEGVSPLLQASRMAVKARFVLCEVQWLSDNDVKKLIAGETPEKAAKIGNAFAIQFIEILKLTNMLNYDLSDAVLKKITKNKARVWN